MAEAPFDREHVAAGVQSLIDNQYLGGPVVIDEEDLDEIVRLVLTVVAPKIREAAYRAGREDAARAIEARVAELEREGPSLLLSAYQLAADVVRFDQPRTPGGIEGQVTDG